MIIISSLLCNQRCPYCFFYKQNSMYFSFYKKNKEILNQKIIDILNYLYKEKEYYLLRFFWAEPLLNRDLPEQIKTIIEWLSKDKQIKIYLNTNLSINIYILDRIKDYLIYFLSKWFSIELNVIITFSWIKEYFQKLRNIDDTSYNNIKKNLDLLYLYKQQIRFRNFKINIINNYVFDIKLLNNLIKQFDNSRKNKYNNKINFNKDFFMKIKNNSNISTRFIKELVIRDLISLKENYKIFYFNILPVFYRFLWSEQELNELSEILKWIKNINKKYNILPKPENYFEQNFKLNNKYYIPLYPYNLVVDYYWNYSYNLINYEDFSFQLLNQWNILNLDNKHYNQLNLSLNEEKIKTTYQEIIDILNNRFWQNMINNMKQLAYLTNKILYNDNN